MYFCSFIWLSGWLHLTTSNKWKCYVMLRTHEMKNRILSKRCLFCLLLKLYELPEYYTMFARKIFFLPNLGRGQLSPCSRLLCQWSCTKFPTAQSTRQRTLILHLLLLSQPNIFWSFFPYTVCRKVCSCHPHLSVSGLVYAQWWWKIWPLFPASEPSFLTLLEWIKPF